MSRGITAAMDLKASLEEKKRMAYMGMAVSAQPPSPKHLAGGFVA